MSVIQMQMDRRLGQAAALTGQWRKRWSRSRMLAPAVLGLDFLARGVLHVWRNARYLTLYKLANMALVNVQFKLKTQRVWGRPYNLKIESTNLCNTHCRLCPTGLGYCGRAKGIMDETRYRGLIDGFKRHLFGLDLSMWGDPLIVPTIFDMIRYAHERRIWTYLSSNLHAFKVENGHAQALVRSGLDMLTCSLHGASQATYGQYQPGKNLASTLEKIRHMVETRDDMGSKTPQVQLNFVVTRHNQHERDAFERLARELGCKAVFSLASLNTRFVGLDKNLQRLPMSAEQIQEQTQALMKNWLPDDPDYVLEPYRRVGEGASTEESFNGPKLIDCAWPWRSSVINWDGAVSACCGSFDSREDLGNVFETSFAKIWNGPRYRAARRSFTREVSGAEAVNNPCATCPGFML